MSETPSVPSPSSRPSISVGFGWRVAVSIVSVFALASFFLLYIAFWASGFNGTQSAALILVAVLVFIAANGAAWASWGARFARIPTP